jgi:hypothetical protein
MAICGTTPCTKSPGSIANLGKWKINVNPSKCAEVPFFYRKKSKYAKSKGLPLTFKNVIIPTNKSTKFLGITIDSSLTFNPNFKSILQSFHAAKSALFPLINRNSQLPLHLKKLIYTAIIRPTVTYGSPIWGASLSRTQLKKLQTCQNKILKSITKARWFHTNEALHNELGIQRVNEFLIEAAKNFKKSLTNHPNPLFQNLWTLEMEKPVNIPQNILLSTDNFPSKPKKVKIHPAIIHLDPPLPSIHAPNINQPNHHSPSPSPPRFLQPPEPD